MDDFLDQLEADVISAVHTLESERYYEFTHSLLEMVHQCKHYQRITESLLSTHAGRPHEITEREVRRATENRDWYRFEETSSEVVLYEGP